MITRVLRAEMLAVLGNDYVRSAIVSTNLLSDIALAALDPRIRER